MASLRKKGQRWHIRWYDSGRSPSETVDTYSADAWSKTDIKAWKRELEVLYEKGDYDPWTDEDPGESVPDLDEALNRFIEAKVKAGRRGERGGWAEGTREAYEPVYESWVATVGPHLPVEDLRQDDVHEFVHRRDLAVSTRRGYRSQLNAFLRWCDTQGWDVPDPIKPIQEPEPQPAYVSEGELYAICDAHLDYLDEAHTSSGYVHRQQMYQQAWMTEAWRFLFYEGLRRGELMRLQVRDVDTSSWTLAISQQKGKKQSVIPIVPPARDVLRPFLHSSTGSEKRGGYRPFFQKKESQLTRAFKQAVRQCSAITDRRRVERLHLHSLRHSCAVYWRRQGVSLADIRDLLRHSSITTTEQYDKIIPSDISRRFEAAAE